MLGDNHRHVIVQQTHSKVAENDAPHKHEEDLKEIDPELCLNS